MMASQKLIVVIDSNILINLFHISRLDLLGKIPSLRVFVPEHVVEEIKVRAQRIALLQTIENKTLRIVKITDPSEIQKYHQLHRVMGQGEAACITLAESNQWIVGTDEKGRVRREILEKLGKGKQLTTVDLVVMAIKSGVISIEQADDYKKTLEEKNFKVKFESFQHFFPQDS